MEGNYKNDKVQRGSWVYVKGTGGITGKVSKMMKEFIEVSVVNCPEKKYYKKNRLQVLY